MGNTDEELEREPTPRDMDIIAEMNAINREPDTCIAEQDGESSMAAQGNMATHEYILCPRPTKTQERLNYYKPINNQLMASMKNHIHKS